MKINVVHSARVNSLIKYLLNFCHKSRKTISTGIVSVIFPVDFELLFTQHKTRNIFYLLNRHYVLKVLYGKCANLREIFGEFYFRAIMFITRWFARQNVLVCYNLIIKKFRN